MLESFRVFKNEIYDTTVEQMIATIKGEFKTTPQMQFGTEVHKFFEDMSTSNLMLEELEQLAFSEGLEIVEDVETVNGVLESIMKEKDRTLQLQMFSLLKTKASEHKIKYNGVTKLFEVE